MPIAGMFGSMSSVQDKKFGYMKRVLIMPTKRSVFFMSKIFHATVMVVVQIPVMIAKVILFVVHFALRWDGISSILPLPLIGQFLINIPEPRSVRRGLADSWYHLKFHNNAAHVCQYRAIPESRFPLPNEVYFRLQSGYFFGHTLYEYRAW